jgi:hypothetical protein
MALPTNGRVVIDTTAGEIDIELWSKVCIAVVQYMVWLLRYTPRKHQKHAGTSLHSRWKVRDCLCSEPKPPGSFGGQVIMTVLSSIGK